MNSKALSILKYIGLLGIGVGLVFLAFRGINFQEIYFSLSNAEYIWLLPSFFFSIIAHYSRAVRWNILIESLGYKTSTPNSFYAVCIGYLANTAVPRLGEVTRCSVLNKTQKAPMDKLIGTVVLERVIDVVIVFILLFSLVGLEYDVFGTFFLELLGSKFGFLKNIWLSVSIGLIAGGLLTFFFIKKWGSRIRSLPFLGKLFEFIEGIWNGLLSIRTINRPYLFIFHSFFVWGMYLLSTMAAFRCLQPTYNLDFGEGLAVIVAGGFGMAAPTPGGIGSYHLLVSEVLTIFGISKADGLAAATLNHLSQTIFIILLGAISFLMLFLQRTKND